MLRIHPFAEGQPEMPEGEYEALRADIGLRGQQEPIVLYRGLVLDGRHRLRACVALGINPTTREFTGTEDEARALVISLNVRRRHLTQEQKRMALKAELQRDPSRSDRVIAKAVGVNDKTASKARRELQSTAEIPQFTATTGADGKVRTRKITVRHPNGSTFERTFVPPAGKKLVEDRVADVRALAAEGMNLGQIAKRSGLSVATVRRYANEGGVRFVDERTHAIRPLRVVIETVNAVVGLSHGVSVVRGAPLDIPQDQARALLEDLRAALPNINWLRDQLRRIAE